MYTLCRPHQTRVFPSSTGSSRALSSHYNFPHPLFIFLTIWPIDRHIRNRCESRTNLGIRHASAFTSMGAHRITQCRAKSPGILEGRGTASVANVKLAAPRRKKRRTRVTTLFLRQGLLIFVSCFHFHHFQRPEYLAQRRKSSQSLRNK